MSTKQVILVRTDLNMRKGKLAAQVSHASMKVFFDRGRRVFQPPLEPDLLVVPLTVDMAEWVYGTFTKIVLGVESEEVLLRAHRLALDHDLPTALVMDIGATEFHGVATYTAVAIGPAKTEDIDPITGPDGLVPTKLL
jgi:peptidyl-tRNA hydrolase, PTH2 family